MSLKNKFLSVLALSVGVAVFTATAAAQDEKSDATKAKKEVEKQFKFGKGEFGGRKFGRHGFMGRGGFAARGAMLGRGFHGIELTDTQKAQINAIRDTYRPDQATMDEVRSIMQARRAGTITAEQETRIKAIRERQMANAKTAHEQIQAVLTAEQKAQIEARKAERKQQMEQRRQKMQEFRQKKVDGAKATPKVN